VDEFLKDNPVPQGTYYTLSDAQISPQKVLRLVLAGTGIKTIPSEVLKFQNLTELDLSNNKLQEIPVWILKLKNLQILNLRANHIAILPPFVFSLPALRVLDLWGNDIHSLTLPQDNFTIEDINLSQNKFTALYDDISKLKHLRWLRFDNNKLTSIPPVIFKMASLQYVYFLHNSISDFDAGVSKNEHIKVVDLALNDAFDIIKVSRLQQLLPNCRIITEL